MAGPSAMEQLRATGAPGGSSSPPRHAHGDPGRDRAPSGGDAPARADGRPDHGGGEVSRGTFYSYFSSKFETAPRCSSARCPRRFDVMRAAIDAVDGRRRRRSCGLPGRLHPSLAGHRAVLRRSHETGMRFPSCASSGSRRWSDSPSLSREPSAETVANRLGPAPRVAPRSGRPSASSTSPTPRWMLMSRGRRADRHLMEYWAPPPAGLSYAGTLRRSRRQPGGRVR